LKPNVVQGLLRVGKKIDKRKWDRNVLIRKLGGRILRVNGRESWARRGMRGERQEGEQRPTEAANGSERRQVAAYTEGIVGA